MPYQGIFNARKPCSNALVQEIHPSFNSARVHVVPSGELVHEFVPFTYVQHASVLQPITDIWSL